ncbi:MAG: 2-oxoacid ferredoxin oxidoreductase [Nitrospirae bacterium CG_4_9_14_3_um_filter_53_35]|nr:MAG: 2-oxoacid ferredoxin oxidoreductase [Nitrospirae bacterium CG2_30_53_67]PIS37510.1 MAG: 2-oxoacid ferredoxin oxidoreductase [Nitrospirae bacterium CG08_land_8_20_14_0_20_52_24]PIV82649.1 MAG: 2-oxoacid ferredoxin oxidoreductase [Nitrospirae bacterium CG17_big_fil_post_rev_8_21_14_2_50_50_9]PIW84296.1 MAG: 2-oxoacid ferredoxin oxidoreductase [Nitrospirae bacterium CG_4_8_14_3_um_filter_50_41]PIX86556.1 MAG: 2-oxoacid ferredoxin oxidoreductase [Nitrospirae bacterium CG_4_10_14_3_um_filter
MVTQHDYGDYETAWCPGCGNFSILKAVKQALAASGIEPHQVLFVAGIGQAAKAPHYLNANLFNGLHGRHLPAATGAKLANPGLTVIAESGDGCTYGEGGNHFLSAIRRNVDLTVLVHDNQVYGLTKGQASPTSDPGFVTKAQPEGVKSEPFNPVALAVAMHAGFVARGFSGMAGHLTDMIQKGIAHRGLSLIDVLQPCVSFNKVNTFAWYKKRCYELPKGYDPENWDKAMATSMEWGEKIPVGIIYRNSRPPYESKFPVLDQGPLVGREVDRLRLKTIMEEYG